MKLSMELELIKGNQEVITQGSITLSTPPPDPYPPKNLAQKLRQYKFASGYLDKLSKLRRISLLYTLIQSIMHRGI